MIQWIISPNIPPLKKLPQSMGIIRIRESIATIPLTMLTTMAQISFEAKAGVSYEDAAASIDKDKLAKALCLSALGYSADDIEVITPEQYEAKYRGDDNG